MDTFTFDNMFSDHIFLYIVYLFKSLKVVGFSLLSFSMYIMSTYTRILFFFIVVST